MMTEKVIINREGLNNGASLKTKKYSVVDPTQLEEISH